MVRRLVTVNARCAFAIEQIKSDVIRGNEVDEPFDAPPEGGNGMSRFRWVAGKLLDFIHGDEFRVSARFMRLLILRRVTDMFSTGWVMIHTCSVTWRTGWVVP
jgi:hypothetical protein